MGLLSVVNINHIIDLNLLKLSTTKTKSGLGN